MNRYLAAYAGTLIVIVGLDLLWLGLIAKPMYQQGIGHLMLDEPNLPVAALFYAMFALALVVFAVAPAGPAPTWGRTVGMAALFGFFASSWPMQPMTSRTSPPSGAGPSACRWWTSPGEAL